MSNQGAFVVGMLAGAGMMYLLDPERGRRRRARVRDRVAHGTRGPGERGTATDRVRAHRDRATGALHESRARLRSGTVDDPVLEARVRAELARLTVHPGRIDVAADHGRVVLTGRAPAGSLAALLAGVGWVRGVEQLVNRLSSHEESGGAPGRWEHTR